MTSSPFARATSACTLSLVMNRAVFSIAMLRIIAVDLATAGEFDLFERWADTGEFEFNDFLFGHFAQRLQFVQAREPYFASVICLGLQFCNHCFRDDYCCTLVFTGLYH